MTNIAMFMFLIMNSIVVLTAYLLARRILKINTAIEGFIAVFLLYLAQIVVSELILGIFGCLTLRNVILLNLAVLLLVILIVQKSSGLTRGSFFSSRFFALRAQNDDVLPLLKNKALLLLASIIIVFGLVKVSINLVNPPFGWDSLNYHFTFAVEWLRNANLSIPITISDDPSPTYYPINGSLFYLWLIFPLKSVFLADLGQVPFFILSFVAVYAIAQKIGLTKTNSFYCAGLFFIIPNFFKQLSIAYVDVIVAGLFLVCVVFLLALEKVFSYKYTLLYSLSFGLMLGVKTVALPYSALLFLPFVYLCVKEEFRRRGHLNVPYGLNGTFPRFKPLGYLLLSLIIIAVLGGYSYFRNWLQTGNPLYPLDFKLWGEHIFKGVIDNATYRAHFKIEDYSFTKMLFHEGLGPQTLIFVLPGIFLALPLAIFKARLLRPAASGGEARNDTHSGLIYLFILPLLIYLVYRYLIPLANVRYLYALLGLGMVLGFYVAQMLNIPKKIIGILTGVCALASMSELAKRQELVTSIILTFVLFFLMPFLIKNLFRLLRRFAPRNDGSAIFFIPIIVILFSVLVFLNQYYIKNEFPNYKKMVKYSGFWPPAADAWNWLNNNTTGNNIAYVGRPVPFPLYGTNFKNNVYYVSVNKTDPAKLEYFPKSHYSWGYDFKSQHKNFEAEGNYRSSADYALWLENLTRRKTDYLFIYSLHQTKDIEFPIEDAWAVAHEAQFSLVYTNNIIHIYKLTKQ